VDPGRRGRIPTHTVVDLLVFQDLTYKTIFGGRKMPSEGG